VFGLSAEGETQAELAVLSYYAPIPPSLDFPDAVAPPVAIETATRGLDQLGVASRSTLLVNGASGSVGSAAVQLAVVRGARVIGTARPAHHEYLPSLGAEPVAYGEGLVERVRALTPDGVDVALDVAGSWAFLAPGRADLPAGRGRRGAPGERGRSRAREARAAGGLSAARTRHAVDRPAVSRAPQRRRLPGRLLGTVATVRRTSLAREVAGADRAFQTLRYSGTQEPSS
jgi:threonine dehydrogenase-like Zn-dependent dehydrogenase